MKLIPCALVCLSALSAAAGQETLTHSHLVSPAGLPKGWTRVETTYGDVSIGLPPGWVKWDEPISKLSADLAAKYRKESEDQHFFRLSFYRKTPSSSTRLGFSGHVLKSPAGKNALQSWLQVGQSHQKALGTTTTQVHLPAGPSVILETFTDKPTSGKFKLDEIMIPILKGKFIYDLEFQIPPEGMPYRDQVFEMAKTVKIR